MLNWPKGFGLGAMVEKIRSSLRISPFKQTLVLLTVPEFIAAGDYLVAKCPSWSWESGESSKLKSYLPPGKQFLVTRNVPCLRRASSYEEEYATVGYGDGDEDDGRRLFQGNPSESTAEDNLSSIEQMVELNKKAPIRIIYSYFGVDNKEDTPDMEKSIKIFSETQGSTHLIVQEPEDSDVTSPRTYDISITYDKDYQTPHFWLTGYNEYCMQLEPELILEDVRRDHAGKTVTIEDHPNLPGKHASVHPRDHGAAVKKMVDDWMSRGAEPEVDKYLFLFLEFVASVFPSIEFGHTMDFDLESGSNQ